MATKTTRAEGSQAAAGVWLRELWETAGQDQNLRTLALRVVLTPTRRVGVFEVRVQAVHLVDGRAAGVVCQVDSVYPGPQNTSLEAHLFSQGALLTARLDEVRATQEAGGL